MSLFSGSRPKNYKKKKILQESGGSRVRLGAAADPETWTPSPAELVQDGSLRVKTLKQPDA